MGVPFMGVIDRIRVAKAILRNHVHPTAVERKVSFNKSPVHFRLALNIR